MALKFPNLVSDLTSNLSNTANTSAMARKKLAQAVANFWASGIGPGGASPITALAKTTIGNGSTYDGKPQAMIAAAKEARDIDNAFRTVTLAGGIYGVHIAMITSGPITLQLALMAARLPFPSAAALAAMKEAQAILAYTLTGVALGSGIPPVIPPQTGPIT